MTKSIKFRILLGFTAALLVFIGIGVYQFIILQGQLNEIKQMKEITLQKALKADEAKLAVVQVQQFLTDISATRGANGLDSGFEEAEKNAQIFAKATNDLIKLNPSEEQKLKEIQKTFGRYYEDGKTMAQAYMNEGSERGNMIMGDFDKTAVSINNQVDKFRKNLLTNISNTTAGLEASAEQTIKVIIILFALIVVSIIIALFSIAQQITKLIKPIECKMKDGELTPRNGKGTLEEADALAGNINLFISKLETMIKKIIGSAAVISTSSQKINTIAEELASTVQNVSGSAEGVSSSIEHRDSGIQDFNNNTGVTFYISSVLQSSGEMSRAVWETTKIVEEAAAGINDIVDSMKQIDKSIKSIGENSKQAQLEADNTVIKASEGSKAVNNTIQGMDTISQSVSKLSAVIKELSVSEEKIGQIVNVIDDIAGQANLLALSAAIEAAKAGASGRGFAVVAESIRELAEKSGMAAKDISKLIEGVQYEIRSAVEIAEDSTAGVKNGAEYMKSTEEVFEQVFIAINKTRLLIKEITLSMGQQEQESNGVVNSIQKMSDLVNQLSATSQEQATGADEVVKSIESVNHLMGQLSSTTEEPSESSHEIVRLIQGINQGIAEVSANSQEIATFTSSLSNQSSELMQLVNKFKVS